MGTFSFFAVTLNGGLNLQAEESESSTDTSTSETSSYTDSSSVLSEEVPDLWGDLDQYFQEGLSPSSQPQDDATGHASDGQNIIHSLEAARLTGRDPGDVIPHQNFEEQPPFHRESVSPANQPLMTVERPQPADRDPGFSLGRNRRRTSSEIPYPRSRGASSEGFPSARSNRPRSRPSRCPQCCGTTHQQLELMSRAFWLICQKLGVQSDNL
ncbi:uncharacterized protein LOC122872234 isoform X1 [Siniperca chuatsi]|uniref:uncharacterized protein LOC122872234 isoform X1 n=1 Tax=Siniperca chuatsi TaxID=119488 RepID=UPI001CE06B0F|nr:uncharacterized protein LOC122872234 isoform X1 [Siniperca chuatsi]